MIKKKKKLIFYNFIVLYVFITIKYVAKPTQRDKFTGKVRPTTYSIAQ